MLYVARHGQTVWNTKFLVCGQVETELTELGRRQASELAEKVAVLEKKVTKILCSPLTRAQETARAVGERVGLEVQIEPAIIEMNFGIYDGRPGTDEAFQKARRQLALPFEGGESVLDVAGRIYPLLNELKAQPEENYLLVCHNAMGRVIENYFHGKATEDFLNFNLENTELRGYEW